MRWLLLSLLVLSSISATAAWPWPSIPGLPDAPDALPALPSYQDLLLQGLWQQNKDRLSFCIGSQLSDARALLSESFPSPLPVGPADDPVCANSTLITAHLCSPQALNFYMKYLLLTDNPEKLPSNRWCDVSSSNPACAPGFFQAVSPPAFPSAVPDLAGQLQEGKGEPHACCPGYLCPSMLSCMIPCPLGAWCPRAWPSDPPTQYLDAAAGGEDGGLLPPQLNPTGQQQPSDKWCAPYAYKLRPELGCGGADKWSVEPQEPFPRRSDWFSGNIYCNGGRYCPNTTSIVDCKPGHYCKTGSSAMTKCPPLLGCPAGTESPTDNWLGFVLVSAVYLMLALMYRATQLYNQLMRRLSSKERMKLMWSSRAIAPEITVVEDDEGPTLYAPPPTARQTAAGGTEAAAAAASPWQAAGTTPAGCNSNLITTNNSSSWMGLPAKLGFLSRAGAQLARRRSSRAGGGAPNSSGGGGDFSMPWASMDDAAVPLLECDMQQQAEELPTIRHHRRTHSGGTQDHQQQLHQLPEQQQHQQSALALKVKAGRSSLEAHPGDLISTAVHTATLIPASLRDRLESNASSGARFFSAHHDNNFSTGDSTDGSGFGGGGATAGAFNNPQLSQLAGLSPPRVQLDVGFEGLGLKLKSCGKMVLQGVTGSLTHGRLAAVMGPSGAGKSSLFSALAGRAPYGILSGKITVNGRVERLEKHKRLMGYVPQNDTMYRTLTVEENLTYSASFRLPASTTPRQRLQVVSAAIDVLGLDDVRHQLIGNEEVRGISGGQVKRVNVGLELVSLPSLLFLDEPTSGLDSSASKLLVQCLQRVARTGVTVAAVIHQPSYETFCLFDDLILLAKGGVTAYYGPQDGVQAYFEGLGFEIPAHVNPADAYLDIIGGAIKPKSGGTLDIAAAWRSRQQHQQQQGPGRQPAEHNGGSELLGGQDDAAVVAIAASRRTSEQGTRHTQPWLQRSLAPWTALAKLPHALLLGLTLLVGAVNDCISGVRNAIAEQLRSWAEAIARSSSSSSTSSSRPSGGTSSSSSEPPGLLRQYSLVLQRAVLMRTREPFLVFIEYTIFAVTGMFVGLMSDRGRGSIGSFVGNIVYSIVAMGMLATISGIKVFGGPDRLVFYREASTGLSKLAHFLALDTWCYVGMVLRCAVYLMMYYTFSQPRAVVWQLYAVTCAIYYSCQGQAFLLSQVMGPNAAQLTAAVSALINALVASKFSTTGALGLMNTISYARWALEGYVIAEANCLKGVWLLARCADLSAFNYNVTQFWYAIRVLLYIGFGSRVAACAAMLTLHRDKSL